LFLSGGRRFRMFVQKINSTDLVVMRELIEAGKMRSIVERVWPFSEVSTALHHVGTGHSRGLNVVRISG
jgi:hypothetical protein